MFVDGGVDGLLAFLEHGKLLAVLGSKLDAVEGELHDLVVVVEDGVLDREAQLIALLLQQVARPPAYLRVQSRGDLVGERGEEGELLGRQLGELP